MGPAQGSMLALVGTAGVAASKIAQGISESNDADKNEMMAKKAKLNAYKLKTAKMKARLERMKVKKDLADFKNTLKKESD